MRVSIGFLRLEAELAKRRAAAEAHPTRALGGIGQELQQPLLVIAFQQDELERWITLEIGDPPEAGGRVGSAVDEIAQHHEQGRRTGRRQFGEVVPHAGQHGLKQVQAAVHVTYGHDAPWTLRFRRSFRPAGCETQLFEQVSQL